jgi:hypothetical protein
VSLSQLQQKILAARARGDTREMKRLQAIYRATPGRTLVSAERGYLSPPIRVVEPAGVERSRDASAKAKPKTRRVDLQPGFFDFRRVVVRDRARDEMLDEIHRWNASVAPEWHGIESGGYLAGYWEHDYDGNDRIVLTRASGPGPNPHNGHDFLQVTVDAGLQLERKLERHERIFGHWHVHVKPGFSRPSQHDLDAWSGLRTGSSAPPSSA